MQSDASEEFTHSRKGQCKRVHVYSDSIRQRYSDSLSTGLRVRVLLLVIIATVICRGLHVRASSSTSGVGDVDMIIPSLHRFHDALLTTSRRDFGDREDTFRAVVGRHHARLRAEAAEAYGGDAGDVSSAAGWSTFVAIVGDGRGRETRKARAVLAEAFSDAAVRTAAAAASDGRHGACFLVHANVTTVEAFLDRPEVSRAGVGELGESAYDGGDSSASLRLFEGGFFALPPELKLSPSLLDHGLSDGKPPADRQSVPTEGKQRGEGNDVEEGPAAAAEPRSTLPGKTLNDRGLVVLLSPGCDHNFGEDGRALAERWRREWSSESLELHELSHWSSSSDDSDRLSPFSKVLTREWSGAARAVRSMAEYQGVTPAEACGWDDVRLTPEAPGLITVREIGHLLPSREKSDEGGLWSPSCLMMLIAFLASRPEAVRVSALPRSQMSNAVAGRIVQGASATTSPVWDHGVDGSGQVVQVVDSGVAEGSCYFRHSAESDRVEHGYLKDANGNLGSGDFISDSSMRKVVQYIEGTRGEPDFTSDDSTGHGSHVSGSVAGSIYDDWEGPADCPVGDATELETALSCMGKCMEPIELSDAMDNKVLDVDALCPEYDCDTVWEDKDWCQTDDRSETLTEGKGAAPGAKLAILDVGTSSSSDQVLGGSMWEASVGTGARVHSGSWGFPDEPCTVDEASVSFDTWAYENPEHLLVFAAGNLGDNMSGCSVSSPSLGKNCLAVGTSQSGEKRFTDSIDEVSEFSSRGFTTDNRIKPDIVAPGHFVLSASNGGEGSCELTVNSGTSMSCPIVAGACALIRQYFQDGFYADDLAARGEQLCPSGDDDDAASFSFPCSSFGASGALVKAMIIHGANTMGGSFDPDGDRGFGRVHVEAAMPFDGEGLWALFVEDDDGSTSGVGQVEALAVEERTFRITSEDAASAVEAGTEDGPGGIRVTLAWMDYPATTLASSQLVHDLDLFLEGPDGTMWTMWGECTGGQSTCTLDSANNVERIVVPAAQIASGDWTVRVSAEKDLSEGGPQSFGLAVSLPISTGSGGGPVSSGGTVTKTPSPSPEGTAADTPSPILPAPVDIPTPSPTAAEAMIDETTNPTPAATAGADLDPSPVPTPPPLDPPSPAPVAVPSVAPVTIAPPTSDPSDALSVAPVATGTVPPTPSDPTVAPSVAPVIVRTVPPSSSDPIVAPSVAPIAVQTVPTPLDATVEPSAASVAAGTVSTSPSVTSVAPVADRAVFPSPSNLSVAPSVTPIAPSAAAQPQALLSSATPSTSSPSAAFDEGLDTGSPTLSTSSTSHTTSSPSSLLEKGGPLASGGTSSPSPGSNVASGDLSAAVRSARLAAPGFVGVGALTTAVVFSALSAWFASLNHLPSRACAWL